MRGSNKAKYSVWSVRIDKEIKGWLKREFERHRSWNKFFKEIKKRYEDWDKKTS